MITISCVSVSAYFTEDFLREKGRQYVQTSEDLDTSLNSKKLGQTIRECKIGDTTIVYGYDGQVHLFSVSTPVSKRHKGSARKALQHFLKVTDENHLTVVLEASPLDRSTNVTKLVDFYSSLGFKKTGKTINPMLDPEMARGYNGGIIKMISVVFR